MQVSLGPHIRGYAPPMADVKDGPTLLHGSLKRFCSVNPHAEDSIISQLVAFVTRVVKALFKPLGLFDVEERLDWIEKINHPEWRKAEYRKAHQSLLEKPLCKADYANKSHGKRETYPEFKPARAINARSDRFKAYTGPYFSAIEKIVFSHPAFIKKIPVCERAQYMQDFFTGSDGPFYETDYSHFESHFTKRIQDALEQVLYDHMLFHFVEAREHIRAALTGRNRCFFRWFSISIDAVRMSGDMCTSLGNGFSNLMLAMFIAERKGACIKGVVEGDDGLFVCDKEITKEDFAAVGFEIKILRFDRLTSTTFCGMTSSADLCLLTDPREVLLNFAWTHSLQMYGGQKVRLGLLRAKALSLLYEHPQCPILTALAVRFIQLTDGHRPIFDRSWYYDQISIETEKYKNETFAKVARGITPLARESVASMYNIGVDTQIYIEGKIRTFGLGEITDPVVVGLFRENKDCSEYYWRFVRPFLRRAAA